MHTYRAANEIEMQQLGAQLLPRLQIGDIVLLVGNLGAGKTTITRGIIAATGYTEPVRSPTFTLINEYKTTPPIIHADLYRVNSAEGLGLDEYLDDHILLIEWPDRWPEVHRFNTVWTIDITTEGDGRKITIVPPTDRAY